MSLIPFQEYWYLYAGFLVFIITILLIDLGLFNKEAHRPKFSESLIWTLVWMSLAGVFNLGVYFLGSQHFGAPVGERLAMEFLTGYVVEKTLAVDNIFIFALVFSFFRVPDKYQHRILFWGILGALVFRGIFVALGAWLMQYHMVVLVFGAFLIFTGVRMLFQEEEGSLEDKWIIRMIRKVIPVSSDCSSGKFFLKEKGVLFATPLLLALIVIEVSDIVFAIDSVPAIYAISSEPFIVFTSNIFAILGLRSMYFLISGSLSKFRYIKYGLAGVLVFVGSKMSWLTYVYGGKFPLSWSLVIIGTLIGGSIILSLVKSPSPAKSV